MTDKYLEWLENQITNVSNARRQYTLDGTRMPKLARDFQKILETLEACKSKYVECKEEQNANSGYGIHEDASWSEVAPDAWGIEGES